MSAPIGTFQEWTSFRLVNLSQVIQMCFNAVGPTVKYKPCLNFYDFQWVLAYFPLPYLIGGLVAIFYFPINIGFMSSSQLTNSNLFQDGVVKPNHQPEKKKVEGYYINYGKITKSGGLYTTWHAMFGDKGRAVPMSMPEKPGEMVIQHYFTEPLDQQRDSLDCCN